MTHFLILLRNLQPKKVHGKPGQAVPLLPATKKTRARASASQHYIQAELLPKIDCHASEQKTVVKTGRNDII